MHVRTQMHVHVSSAFGIMWLSEVEMRPPMSRCDLRSQDATSEAEMRPLKPRCDLRSRDATSRHVKPCSSHGCQFHGWQFHGCRFHGCRSAVTTDSRLIANGGALCASVMLRTPHVGPHAGDPGCWGGWIRLDNAACGPRSAADCNLRAAGTCEPPQVMRGSASYDSGQCTHVGISPSSSLRGET